MNKYPTPKFDQILIRPFSPDEISEGGIIVPESFQVRNNKARVIAVGVGTIKKPMFYKIGQTVYNIKDHGDEILIDGIMHYLIKADYILAYEDEPDTSIHLN